MHLTSPPPDGCVFDVCMVGAGPVGLSLALETANSGLRVLLVEAGHQTRRASGTPLDETIAAVVEDERVRGIDRERRAGLTRAEELALLQLLG